jgi:hypothetical protein
MFFSHGMAASARFPPQARFVRLRRGLEWPEGRLNAEFVERSAAALEIGDALALRVGINRRGQGFSSVLQGLEESAGAEKRDFSGD